MDIKIITGSKDFIESLRGKSASFLLALSYTKTANIKNITQAGIPEMLFLTPVLDAEFLCIGEAKSLPNIASTPKGVPTPALITRAVHLLKPFSSIELLNLGLESEPKLSHFTQHKFSIQPSQKISENAQIDAKAIFEKGLKFGQEYKTKNDYIILGESVPSGTSTAKATAMALGYDAKNLFSSSYKNNPFDLKELTIQKALEHIKKSDTMFQKLGKVSDNMLLFNAGFLYGIDSKIKIILAGGTQMASVLLILNSFLQKENIEFNADHIALCTTKWLAKDPQSDIKALLEMLDFSINSYYTDFDFSLSDHPALKLYDEGEAKEGVGAGGALVYAVLNGLNKKDITQKVESFLR